MENIWRKNIHIIRGLFTTGINHNKYTNYCTLYINFMTTCGSNCEVSIFSFYCIAKILGSNFLSRMQILANIRFKNDKVCTAAISQIAKTKRSEYPLSFTAAFVAKHNLSFQKHSRIKVWKLKWQIGARHSFTSQKLQRSSHLQTP